MERDYLSHGCSLHSPDILSLKLRTVVGHEAALNHHRFGSRDVIIIGHVTIRHTVGGFL